MAQSSELAGTVTGREITQLQLNGRDFTQLITLVPGVSNQNLEDQGFIRSRGSRMPMCKRFADGRKSA